MGFVPGPNEPVEPCWNAKLALKGFRTEACRPASIFEAGGLKQEFGGSEMGELSN